MRPRRNDRVVSPYAGRKLTDGGAAPRYGVVRRVSRGVAYIDFSVGSQLEAVHVRDLRPAGARVWEEAR